MRLLHSADWHLGRLFHARSLLEDQAYVLNSLVDCVREVRPDALLIAGDVYDRAVPPPEAVALLDDVLAQIVLGLKVPVVMIAGNHDSADRLGFGSQFLSLGGLHVAGRISTGGMRLALRDKHGELTICGLPYADPALVRDEYADDKVHSHEHAMRVQLGALRASLDPASRTVLVAHAFVVGGRESESERPLTVGGSGAVAASVFAGFDYVALGHLHAPQSLAEGAVRYAGSLLKYSISEADHGKSVSLVEVGAKGELAIEEMVLSAKRDLRVLEGTLAELLSEAENDACNDDYIYARLTDTGALLDPMSRLREAYPNALAAERLVLARAGEASSAAGRLRQLDAGELFADFVKEVAGEEVDESRRAEFNAVLRGMAVEEREAQ